jgi:hypothetical protein
MTAKTKKPSTKSISKLATFIKEDWKDIHPQARPYLNAMTMVKEGAPDEMAIRMVTYFLKYATTYHNGTIKEHLADIIADASN